MTPARERFAKWTVVEIASGFGPAMIAAKLLADLGCPVIKLEDRGGDPLRARASLGGLSLFDLLNASKDSVCADFSHARASEVVEALLRTASIVVADRDGIAALDRWVPDQAERFPHVTVAACTPFGLKGTFAKWDVGEEGIQAMSGIMSTTHHPGGRPVRVAGAVATHTSAMHAVTSILADVHGKRVTGRGARLDVATFDAAITMLTAAVPAFFLTGRSPPGIGNRHSMAAPWNTYRCANGWTVICAGNEPTWQRLLQVIGREALSADPRYATQQARVANADALDAEVEAWTCTRSVADVERLLDENAIPSGPILPLAEVVKHPQFQTRQLLVEARGTPIAGGVFHRDRDALEIRAGLHAIGAGNRNALVERAGVEPGHYERWVRDGVIVAAEGRHVAAA
jgi:CoA:oxalate CoA-transferase